MGKLWLFIYGIALTALSIGLEHTTHVHLEVLLPAFALGCILFNLVFVVFYDRGSVVV